ncbi:MAG: MBL fold metallo-hydrolase [Alphaproteobacteria bacterium]
MLVRFWGTRGSLPTPLNAVAVREKIRRALRESIGHDISTPERLETFIDEKLAFSVSGTFGGNSSCVEIESGGTQHILCDMGSGGREFGNAIMAQKYPNKEKVINIFQSHPHWDHIMGFPFFVPAYVPGFKVVIHGCHANLEEAYRRQHSEPGFPVPWAALGADIQFVTLEPGKEYVVDGVTVRALKQHHSGDSYGYRFEKNGKSIVYTTDSEHKFELIDDDYPFIHFLRGADLVIFDAMYSLADSISIKEDWGHSSNIIGVELAQRAGAKHLCMYHHEPNYDDAMIERIMQETIRYEELSEEGDSLIVSSAYDGREIVV